MPHTCARCGSITFKHFHEYKWHMEHFHGLKSPIRPVNVTGRTKLQIVQEAESTWLQPYIVHTSDKHPDSCRCDGCFQHQLALLLDKTQAALDNAGNT